MINSYRCLQKERLPNRNDNPKRKCSSYRSRRHKGQSEPTVATAHRSDYHKRNGQLTVAEDARRRIHGKLPTDMEDGPVGLHHVILVSVSSSTYDYLRGGAGDLPSVIQQYC